MTRLDLLSVWNSGPEVQKATSTKSISTFRASVVIGIVLTQRERLWTFDGLAEDREQGKFNPENSVICAIHAAGGLCISEQAG
jgi:hypothetical protein